VSHHEVNDPNSYLGFKGEDSLGGGMKGWFQVESRIRGDTGTGDLSSRNTAVGLSGGFGNVFLGRWDTVYKQLGDPASFLGISAGNFVSSSGMLSKPYTDDGNQDFHLRRNNYIEYDSPTFAGVTIMAGYSPDEGKIPDQNKWLRSVGVKFEAGPLYLALANEVHNDFSANPNTGVRTKDTGTRFSVKFALPTNTVIAFDVANLERQSTGPVPTNTGKHRATSLVVTQQIDKIGLAAGLVNADKASVNGSDVAGSEAMQLNLGVKYDLSKRTGVYAIYSKLTNKESAQFNNLSSGSVGAGVDPEQIGVGVTLSF
jgi:predicted porin